LKKGDRVQFSDAGLKAGYASRRNNGRRGTIIGFSRDKGAVYVRWDGGHHQGESYARKYIQLFQ
jgi:hypothetical protein